MLDDVINTRTQKIWLDKKGILYFEYFSGAENKLEDAIESIEAAKIFCETILRPALIDISF